MAEDDTGRFVVVTGGPGSGKTTLLDELACRGVTTMPEAGRAVIRDQTAVGGSALPWDDRALFAELMLSWEMRSHHWARRRRGLVLFDRGVPDVIGYLRLAGAEVPEHVHTAAGKFRYHRRVFVAPPWPEIFERDEQRRQDLAEAERTHEMMVEVYTRLGYDLVTLPRADPPERAAFVLEELAATTPSKPGR
ncbi:ATPase [Actinopolyspora erythraea]|uniref:ATPase n=1 Tax=Actinopolyspora erythraea TaxID=414996 RepID=A0A099D332_9ACTN|nr:AAA family ATPase [Actinopolyspora erythraea]ASU77300.1 ATPase [Actinopolyspora erythraea]KGI80212.1 ATPase [Actinopolyspora erythraea]